MSLMLDLDRVLIIDDEPRQLEILRTILGREGLEVDTASTAEAALASLRDAPAAVILTDLKLPGRDGINLLEEAAVLTPQSCVIIMTAHGSVDTAVEAMKKGAFDYLTKPLVRDTVVLAVRRALDKARLLRENQSLHEQLLHRFSLANIIGDHGKMQEVFRVVRKVAPSASTIIIYGESGTGKELIAQAIHYNSPRASKPFLAINCAAIPEPLLESELFGHEKGSFTGATARKLGLFEQASGGTLFLDEVGDLGQAMQAKLLRALQEKEIRRVGGNASLPVDVRILAATNKSLPRLMREGRFREDLFYRLNVLTIMLPPLRERTTDIPLLVDHFVGRHAAAAGKKVRGVDPQALTLLMAYPWPGNVRQLESVVERAVLLCEGTTIGAPDLPLEIHQGPSDASAPFEIPDAGISFEALEKSLLQQALRKGGSMSRAARLLGMSRRTFQYRLEKFGIGKSVEPDVAGEWGDSERKDDRKEEMSPELSPAPDGAPAAPNRTSLKG